MDNTSEKSQKKKRSKWSIEAEELLLVLWAQNYAKLQANRTKFYILSKMSTKMEEMGYPFTAYEISVKMHNLKSRYRDERKRIADGFPSPWPMYDSIHRIVEGNHTNQKEKTNHGTQNPSTGDNYGHHDNPSEEQYDDDNNCNEYPNEDSYDNNADETVATTTLPESRDNTNKSDETKYLKSINRNLVLLVEKINELSEQTRLMENERNASLKQLLDVFKHHTREKPRHNSTRNPERHFAKKIKLSKHEDMGATTRDSQDQDYETFSQYIQEDDPLCNESDMNSVDEEDKQDENIDEDLTSHIKKSPPSLQSNKIVLEKKLKEEYLRTKQMERDFMTEKHKLQMEILNVELEAKRNSVLK